ncbi:helix-turn-helix transcriptional regulator [Plantactinospora sp. KBS50]|uniref:helix-turn-helix transcriptional regulator n=1 Tax=Plantactinospora sp. KBS50 TaxID=2024580 RepID=UPI000BAAA826|nr:helix-turn-helix transcriptional regulator [Plantactinospora sp. KBS50]ASW55863.1 hypothetical protein CIK06_19335 [Plantactinospora sp. KBS50]
MSTDRLQKMFRTLLRRQRELHGLTQAQLAARAGISQASIARIEAGGRAPSLPMTERILAALGSQLTIDVEPLDADVDRQIIELSAKPVAERVRDAGLDWAVDRLDGLPYVFTGATAALLQGAPVSTRAVEIAVAWPDADAFTDWLIKRHAQRWHDRWQVFSSLDVDPREPGAHRWDTGAGEIVATMCPRAPESIEVRHDGQGYRVVPLALVEVTDPVTARLLRRHRERQGNGTDPDAEARPDTEARRDAEARSDAEASRG